jgi:hypothetical protein
VEEKSRARRRTTPPGAAQGEGRRRPELHRAGAPIVFTNAAVLPARPRPTGSDPPPHRTLLPSAPPVSRTAANPSSFPCCRREPRAAGEQSVAGRRTPSPSGRRAVFSCRSPTRRPFPRYRRRLTTAASCRGPGMPAPRARHGHAAALGNQDSRACVHRTQPCLSLACTTTSPCTSTPATRPRRRVRVAAMPLRHFPERPSGVHTRTRASALTRTHTLICRAASGLATSDPAEADNWAHPVREEKKRRQPDPRGGEDEASSQPTAAQGSSRPRKNPTRGGPEPSQTTSLASPLPDRPAEPQAELTPRA